MSNDILIWTGLVAIAVVPNVFYAIYIRNIEKWEKEPWSRIAMAFIWGMVAGVIFTVAFKMYALGNGDLLSVKREYEYMFENQPLLTLFVVAIMFPLMGELVKLLGALPVKSEITEVEDGLIYGAAMGLGFAASANLFYLYVSMTNVGIDAAAPIAMSSISNTLLHASASGVAGYGISKMIVKRELFAPVIFLLAGMFIHSSFNMLSFASVTARDNYGTMAYAASLLGVVLISHFVFRAIRARMLKLIAILDQETHDEAQ